MKIITVFLMYEVLCNCFSLNKAGRMSVVHETQVHS